MGSLYDDRSDEEWQRDYELWWWERGWLGDLLAFVVVLLLIAALWTIGVMMGG